ncbi:MAG TPA: cysteine desulfurase [Gammaproteobacteria bacterium]|nr:cysteine desulfurase [Gammaproteobacteria bacterium]
MSAEPSRNIRRRSGLVTDIASLRADFPALQQRVHGDKPLAYLDSAASSQCPAPVLEAMLEQQRMNHANVHRGVHALSQRATDAYEGARERVRGYINALGSEEIVFTRGTTESINLVAASLGASLRPGDEVLITEMEHHSNLVPWQLACERTGAKLVPAPITDAGELDLDAFVRLLTERTRIVAVGHVSNALGTVNPIAEITAKAHAAGALVLVDGAQAMAHMRIDVQALDCDFYAFSGHKMYAPTGIGVLYGKRTLLEALPPYQGGGEMILSVSFGKTVYNALPYKFEAGTPNITGAVALGAAVDYLARLDFGAVAAHEHALLEYATERVLAFPGARVVGTARHKAGVLSFVFEGIHAHDLGTIVDLDGVAIRTGHHCAMPLMERFGIAATARASFALYSDRGDVERLVAGLEKAVEIFA